DDEIVAGPANDRVRPRTAKDRIGTGTALDRHRAAAAVDNVGTRAADDQGRAIPAIDRIIARAADDRRIPLQLQGPLARRHVERLAVVGQYSHPLVARRQPCRRDDAIGDDLEIELTRDGWREILPVGRRDHVDLLAPLGKSVVLATWN